MPTSKFNLNNDWELVGVGPVYIEAYDKTAIIFGQTPPLQDDVSYHTIGIPTHLHFKYQGTQNTYAKSITAQPCTIVVSNFELLSGGAGVDDSSGSNNVVSSSNLPVPDLLDENNPIYFYFGWINNGNWIIHKQVKSTSVYTVASLTNNTSYATLDEAWLERENLTYI